MIEYPKIETLYDRGDDFNVDPSRLRVQEFANVKTWHITEKIDGTNVRVGLMPDGSVVFGGRTDNAQMPTQLSEYLRRTFTPEKLQAAFEKNADGTYPEVVLFGEGYGAKIQKGGGLYRADVAFRLFDVRVANWWLSPANVFNVAMKLAIETVPGLAYTRELPKSDALVAHWLGKGLSLVASQDSGQSREAEGVVARAYPMLYDARGHRLMWKLKFSDFRKGRK